MAVHIKEFYIGAFKGIKDLSLKELNHINILTGNNNTGKTSILELLFTLSNPKEINNWLNNERVIPYLKPGRNFNYFLNLFPVDSGLTSPVNYSYTDILDNKHYVQLSGTIEKGQMPLKEINEISGIRRNRNGLPDEELNLLIDTKKLSLDVSEDSNFGKRYEIYDFENTHRIVIGEKPNISISYVSPVAHSQVTNLSSVLSDVQFYNDMILLLQEFDENIVNITSIEQSGYSEYMIISNNHKSAIPLSFYGDGMKKSLSLLCAIINSRNGILLVDEFETAIHTSAMDHVFSWLLKSAIKLNVQVFLTSHSKEAINKVLRCDESLSDKISYYTLFNYEGKNLVRKLSCSEAIKLQDQGGMDIR